MRKIEGLSQREIAERLDVSESIVENEVFRGVQAVQRAWREGEAKAEARMAGERRSEEHTSELQSLMRIPYAVFCLKKTLTQTDRLVLHRITTDVHGDPHQSRTL